MALVPLRESPTTKMSHSDDHLLDDLLDHIRTYDPERRDRSGRSTLQDNRMDVFATDSSAVADALDVGDVPVVEEETVKQTVLSADHALDLYASLREVELRGGDPVHKINEQVSKLRARGWTIEPPEEK